METLRRIYNVLFGNWFSLNSDKSEFTGERLMGGTLLLSAREDGLQIQIRLTSGQADALQDWLKRTGGPLNTAGPGKLIRLVDRKHK